MSQIKIKIIKIQIDFLLLVLSLKELITSFVLTLIKVYFCKLVKSYGIL
jgi:hypothetical protein